MLKYLEKDNITRNNIFEYAFNVTKTEYDKIEIEN